MSSNSVAKNLPSNNEKVAKNLIIPSADNSISSEHNEDHKVNTRFHVTKSSQNLEEQGKQAEEADRNGIIGNDGKRLQSHHSSNATFKSDENSNISRKTSLAGRFTVLGREPSVESSLNSNNDENHLPQNQRTVKFNVAHSHDSNDGTINTISSGGNNTINMKSLRNFKTIERPPIMDYYRNTLDPNKPQSTRPSMAQLLSGQQSIDEMNDLKGPRDPLLPDDRRTSNGSGKQQIVSRKKFGWIEGVYFRCLLNIFGVMLYLRVSWVAGQAGIILGCAVVLLASVVTTITALSTCAICTNGDVKGGGAYFLISRSLGPEFGGSIGIIFSFANAVSAAMYIVGFAETVRDLFKSFGYAIIDGEMNDVRIIGLITCVILICIVFIGTGFESKMQMGLLVILTLSIINYFVGIFIPPTEEKFIKGLTGLSYTTMITNLMPAFRNENFFSVFSVYFPAATGIMAGANISGDLANPQQAIPLGTLAAIFSTTIIYILTVIATGSTCLRDVDGITLPIQETNATNSISYYVEQECLKNQTCEYGLMNNFQIMEMTSFWGPLITAGIFAATLSSALASLVSAPKVFQAVCKDKLFPYINAFGKGSGKDDEPRKAYLLGFVICMVMILIGELNAIAPIISNFFLASYALINYACFDNSIADSPGFRPSFKYYNKWVSLLGAVLCIMVMFIISWSTALITFACFMALYLYLLYRKPDVNWGSSGQAHTYRNALKGMQKLNETAEHVKNYRPQILILCGSPTARPSLVDFANNICKGSSLMVCGNIILHNPNNFILSNLQLLNTRLSDWLKRRHIRAFVSCFVSKSFLEGAESLIQTSGLGKLRPDVLLMGFKSNWKHCDINNLTEINDYFKVIQCAFDSNMGVCILRNSGDGFDFSNEMRNLNMGDHDRLNLPTDDSMMNIEKSVDDCNETETSPEKDIVVTKNKNEKEQKEGEEGEDSENTHSYLDINVSDEEEEGEDEGEEDDRSQSTPDSQRTVSQMSLVKEDVECGRNVTFDDSRNDTIGGQSSHHQMSINDKVGLLRRKRRFLFGTKKSTRRPTAAQRELLSSINRFKTKVKQATIDVWWLFDDGGLTLFLPYLLTIPKSYLENATLRVFTVSASSSGIAQMQRGMAGLLNKFRIKVSDVHVISDITKKPQKEIVDEFNTLIEPFRCNLSDDAKEGQISDAELAGQRDKTNRQLRIAELLRDNSSSSDLICITLPVPRRGMVSSSLYLAWLEMMTRGLPPTLLVRGNQSSVLTFYS
uniref:Amino acid permease/ SLC12A domain-containing protein n=1 Tax=Strongyloides stercoralis TaxID=6248 RepID=A0A913HXZ6_STRER